VPSSEKASLGVFIDDDVDGVVVSDVVTGSAADKAGIQKGDGILRLNDEMITSYRELSMLMNKYSKGEKINLQIERKGKKQLVEVELD
jgi:S1-C subfamily serine protease